jgi:hypothetical protein
VAELTVNVLLVPLKRTAVAPVKLVPVMVTAVPAAPEVGVKLVMVGAGAVTVKLVELNPVLPPVFTPIMPVVALAGTVAVIWLAEFTTKPLPNKKPEPKDTTCAPWKLSPVITTWVPAGPLVGEKE